MLNTYLPVLFQMYKEFYDGGVYNEDNLKYFVSIGTLSEEDYQKIVTKDNGEKVENEASNGTVVQGQAQQSLSDLWLLLFLCRTGASIQQKTILLSAPI